MKILITGATGFIGQHLVHRLASAGHHLILPSRQPLAQIEQNRSGIVRRQLSNAYSATCWLDMLVDVDVVVHLAGRAHVFGKHALDYAEYHRSNVELPVFIGGMAAEQRVRRFVFVSSIGVMGAPRSTPFTADDTPAPRGLYEKSKLEAELELKRLTQAKGMELTVVRPPLVYGPNAPGNFGRLLRLAATPVPVPLGAIHNKRSIVSVYNLVDLLAVCCEHPRAAGNTFLVCDGVDISTTELLRVLSSRKKRSAWLAPVPASIVRAALAAVGRADLNEKLLDSLQIDQSHTCRTLDWHPPYSLHHSIELMERHESA